MNDLEKAVLSKMITDAFAAGMAPIFQQLDDLKKSVEAMPVPARLIGRAIPRETPDEAVIDAAMNKLSSEEKAAILRKYGVGR